MTTADSAHLTIETGAAQALHVRCAGRWTVQELAALDERLAQHPWPQRGDVTIDASALAALDTSGAWLMQRTIRALEARGCTVQVSGMPPQFVPLLQLVAARAGAPGISVPAAAGLLTRAGWQAWQSLLGAARMLSFLGENALTLLRGFREPRRWRLRHILYNLQTAGFEALPITGMLSFLMGIVIAYQGADQLKRFGANIFVADLVGIAMLRELSPLLTAIIVAGRSGSAYTAQIGTMKVTEEIDALRTVGVSPQELLVLPKMLALVVVLPLLTVYTDVTGVLGGMLMAQTQLGLSFDAFLERLDAAIVMSTYLTGISKAPVFAMIIALVGCYRGFETAGSADSVGRQTTISVVQSIFLVIVTDAIFSVVFNLLDL